MAHNSSHTSIAPTVLQLLPESTDGLVRHVVVRPRCGRLFSSLLVQRSGHDGQGERLNSIDSWLGLEPRREVAITDSVTVAHSH